MARLLIAVLAVCSLAAACDPSTPSTAAPAAAAGDGAPGDGWVDGVNAAGWDFHRHLEGNAVSSPVSIGAAFSLARAGASPESAAALDEIFGFPETGAHTAAGAVGRALAAASGDTTIVEVASRLFPDDEFTPRSEFLEVASTHYRAGIEPVDTADGDTAADAVNRWAAQTTRGLIPSIVDADAVKDEQLVLVNTVYLKADWVRPLQPLSTRDEAFTTSDGQQVPVPLMWQQRSRRFVRLDDADAVELRYRGGELAMWIVVPRALDGLAAVEEALDAAALTALSDDAETGEVALTMPMWEQTLPPSDLFKWLCPQGFCAGAGFDGIAADIVVTAALHGAKIIVDEHGTEAAAATAVGSGPTSLAPEPVLVVDADRPFLWAIIHQPTGAVLFLGRLTNPAG